ncbi:hypothetical protein OsJ_25956 [Oryza sativa Japonica Group]|uniref:Uncharacterized protein n=1 Tax=Oryza sativa subsp. japonica TaxID=39947 RepID=B9FYY4_ORYSJ|nr:hypothetical protein OsJ_25956 [Oryza sativa Japonica Group]
MVQASAAALRRLGAPPRRRSRRRAAPLRRRPLVVILFCSGDAAPAEAAGGGLRRLPPQLQLVRLAGSPPVAQSASASERGGRGHGHGLGGAPLDEVRKSSMATVSSEPDTSASQSEILHFIKSTFGTLEGSKDHALFSNLDEELEVLIKGMDNAVLKAEPSDTALESRVSWQKEEVPKEPYVGSIGCSPGFEDGEFESAKFLRPAASFYNTAEDCLYIVDSENHAVRKADLGRRMLETVYPVSSKSSSGIWSWIVDKLGLRREDAPSENFIADSIAFPWHLLNITEDDFLVADRNFEASWILSVSTGQKQEIGRGIAEEMESYQQIIHERCALLKDMNMNWSSSAKEHSDLLGKIPFKELVSSVARFQKYIIFCDADGQRVLKHDLDTNGTSNIQFSNFGVLGLPYWFVCHLERVSTRGHSIGKFQEHTRKVNVLPGRCNIKVSVDIPADTQLAAPLVESCIWRQVRGSGAEVSGFDEPSTSTEKVGIAQQWYDEIDNLAFSEVPEEPTVHEGDENLSDGSYQEQRRAHFNCVVNVSPGTCELVASAALYLKIDSAKDDHGEQKSLVKRIIQCQRREDHAGVELLMESCKDSRDLTIMKPVHLRLMLECADHPAGTTNKETISSESSFEINISLD